MSDPPKPPTDSDRTSPPNDSPAGGTVDGIAPDKNSTSGGSKSDEGAEPPAPDKTNAYSDPSLKAGVSPSPSANGTSADIVNKAKGIASKGVQQGESWAKANPGAIVAIVLLGCVLIVIILITCWRKKSNRKREEKGKHDDHERFMETIRASTRHTLTR